MSGLFTACYSSDKYKIPNLYLDQLKRRYKDIVVRDRYGKEGKFVVVNFPLLIEECCMEMLEQISPTDTGTIMFVTPENDIWRIMEMSTHRVSILSDGLIIREEVFPVKFDSSLPHMTLYVRDSNYNKSEIFLSGDRLQSMFKLATVDTIKYALKDFAELNSGRLRFSSVVNGFNDAYKTWRASNGIY